MVNAMCMADFVAYCSLQRSRRGGFLKASTIRDYCNGVGKAHLRLFGVDPVEPLQLHRKVLEGVRKRDLADGWVPKRKLPFTKGMLLRCSSFFNLFNPADLELWAACNLASELLLRVSEVVPTKADHWPRRKDLRIEYGQAVVSVSLFVRSSKASWVPCTRWVNTALPADPASLAAIMALWLVRSEGASPEGPLFPSLKYAAVMDAIKRMAVVLGMPDPQDFGTHSFRRGGAYDLSAGGWSEEHVRVMGRWASDTWARAYAELAFSVVSKSYGPPVLGPLRGGGDCLDHASGAPGGEPMVC
jgi:hypothetical protein